MNTVTLRYAMPKLLFETARAHLVNTTIGGASWRRGHFRATLQYEDYAAALAYCQGLSLANGYAPNFPDPPKRPGHVDADAIYWGRGK